MTKRSSGHTDSERGLRLGSFHASGHTGTRTDPRASPYAGRPRAAGLAPLSAPAPQRTHAVARLGEPARTPRAEPHPERPGAPLMSGREGRAVTAQCARRMSTAPLGPARFLGHQFNESAARLSPQDSSIPCQGEPSSTAHTVSVCLS